MSKKQFPWPRAEDDEIARAVTFVTARLGQGKSVPVIRVSSAKARGRAKNYSYWGVARYELRLGACGQPVLKCTSAASPDRRAHRLAQKDAEAYKLPEIWETRGIVSWTRAAEIINEYNRMAGKQAAS